MPSARTLDLVHDYQTKANALLDEYTMTTGHLPQCPAECLTGLVRQIGWGLRFEVLPEDRWAECNRTRKVIRVAKNLPDRLEYPEQARRVCHAALAHELGHAVLHSAPRRSRTVPKRWEWEAHVFACVLLCPWRLILGRPELLALRGNMLTMKERWAAVGRLADEFQVTTSFMVASLQLYGVLERTPAGGIQAPYEVLISPARPWKKAA